MELKDLVWYIFIAICFVTISILRAIDKLPLDIWEKLAIMILTAVISGEVGYAIGRHRTLTS